MTISSPHAIKWVAGCFSILFVFSCSKDTDLLADYVVSDTPEAFYLKNYVVDDTYIIDGQKSVILDVLSNDLFINSDEIKIVETSEPIVGTVIINENNTITYHPGTNADQESENVQAEEPLTDTITGHEEPASNNIESFEQQEENIETEVIEEPLEPDTEEVERADQPSEPNEDSFTYTVETVDEDGTTETVEAEVKVELDYGELKAFPGAEGYGKSTTGGRAGRVMKVTNLNDGGPGSLREAIEASGPRTIVFDVSGYINLTKPLRIKNSDITIAGQTAPGDGITLRNGGIEILTGNVIIRYLRVRPGIGSPDGLDAIRVIQRKDDNNMENIIIDHCSLSWAKDEVLSFGVNGAENSQLKNITVQNCIISEAIDNQYGVLVMGEVLNTTFTRNYLANNKDRQFRASTAITEFEVINNIIYNFRWGTQLSYGGKFDVINNVYKNSNNVRQSGNAMTYISSSNTPDAIAEEGKVHQSGNRIINSDYSDTNTTFSNHNQDKRVHSNSVLQPWSTNNLENKVLADVGASIFNDPIDQRIIANFWNSTGNFIKSETEVGGYPTLDFIKRENSYDEDNDGMEDYWELENGLNPNDPEDGKEDRNQDGFTNLEDFLHYCTMRSTSNSST